jgi:hypothetical protein
MAAGCAIEPAQCQRSSYERQEISIPILSPLDPLGGRCLQLISLPFVVGAVPLPYTGAIAPRGPDRRHEATTVPVTLPVRAADRAGHDAHALWVNRSLGYVGRGRGCSRRESPRETDPARRRRAGGLRHTTPAPSRVTTAAQPGPPTRPPVRASADSTRPSSPAPAQLRLLRARARADRQPT